jgi:hypothetical protein
MFIARMPLRRINENLRFTVPPKLREELGLNAGDYVDWVRDGDSVKLKFVKVEPPALPAELLHRWLSYQTPWRSSILCTGREACVSTSCECCVRDAAQQATRIWRQGQAPLCLEFL